MGCTRRSFVNAAGGIVLASGLAGCTPASSNDKTNQDSQHDTEQNEAQEEILSVSEVDEFADLAIDMEAWHYNEDIDCYYQLALTYCLTPASVLEQLAIFVPGAYFRGEEHGKTYSCTINNSARVGDFTPTTAPVVMPINTVRYGIQEPPSAFGADGLERYLKAGFVYVYVGLRGRSSAFESNSDVIVAGGAPWAVVDIKAATRYLRYNASALPCDTERIFVFGMGGGGGIGMVAAASGDAQAFRPYLISIGAALRDADGQPLSDAFFGTASWCPMTSFDVADAAYEWECGQYSSSGARTEGRWERLLSRDLVAAYAHWVNDAGLVDTNGTPLMLDEVSDGSYTAGTYYDHILTATEEAANAFLATTQFPYTYAPTPTVVPAFPGNPSLTLISTNDIEAVVAETTNTTSPNGVTNVQATVYDSAEAYIEALNMQGRWLTYNSYWGTVRVSGLWDMARAVRTVQRGVGAFDAIDRSSSTNQLFGIANQTTLHFSRMMRSVISSHTDQYAQAKGWDPTYPEEWLDDLKKRDTLGNQVGHRVDMMNPLSYVCASYASYGSTQVAPHWRVNAGLFQTETSLAVVANLAIALSNYPGIESIAFTPVWGQGFELAERLGDPQDNLISWIQECCDVEND